MASRAVELGKEAQKLVDSGVRLYYALGDANGQTTDEQRAEFTKHRPLPNFVMEYETWYSEALSVVKQLTPDRLEDFVKCYKDPKRKEINYGTYTISDALINLHTTYAGSTKTDPGSAASRMLNQVQILTAATGRLRSSLFDIHEVVQADIYENELDAARGLNKAGFVRAAGAMAGVVLEAHLKHVCEMHSLKPKSSKPTMVSFYELLRDSDVIDVPKWRFIQSLADVRNLCDHKKDRDPNKDEVFEMIDGVGKILKTVF